MLLTLAIHKTVLTIKNSPAPNVSSAKAEKLWSEPRRFFSGIPFTVNWDGIAFLGKANHSNVFQCFTGFLEKNNDLLYRHLKEVSLEFNYMYFWWYHPWRWFGGRIGLLDFSVQCTIVRIPACHGQNRYSRSSVWHALDSRMYVGPTVCQASSGQSLFSWGLPWGQGVAKNKYIQVTLNNMTPPISYAVKNPRITFNSPKT